jgi:hypothetical protein
MIDTSPLSILCTDRPMSNADRLAEWRIAYNPKPIPSRNYDWDFSHIDYDGAPDSGDNRRGTASSPADAIRQIHEITSPPQGQPQGVTLSSLVLDTLGFVLAVGIPVALVYIAAALMGAA